MFIIVTSIYWALTVYQVLSQYFICANSFTVQQHYEVSAVLSLFHRWKH